MSYVLLLLLLHADAVQHLAHFGRKLEMTVEDVGQIDVFDYGRPVGTMPDVDGLQPGYTEGKLSRDQCVQARDDG